MEDDFNQIDDGIEEAGFNNSEEEGTDLMENMEQDYEERPELDRYEDAGIDDGDENQELSVRARLEIER
jgi:hypothetical protein